MAFYTHFPATEFAPIFQLLNDCDAHRSTQPKQTAPTSNCGRRQIWNPRFDVREANDEYYLEGELPGAEQNDIEIEFTDSRTLVIKGKTTRVYQTLHESPTEADTESSIPSGVSTPKSYHATVEEAREDGDEAVMVEPATRVSSNRENSTLAKDKISSLKETDDQFKYRVSERLFGEFSRIIHFPQRVNQDAVRANLKNGILSLVVPKEPAYTVKKIRIV